nr:hypothetical protein [uncultured Cohaesibacter sp.]
MQLFGITIGALVLSLILRILGKRAMERAETRPLSEQSKPLAFASAISTLGAMSFWFGLSAGATWAILFSLTSNQAKTLSEAQAGLEQVRQWTDLITQITGGFGLFVTLFASAGVLIWVYRRTKRSSSAAFSEALQQSLERLEAQRIEGTLEDLPPNEAMTALQREIALAEEAASALGDEATPAQMSEIREKIVRLAELHFQVDVLRRAEKDMAENAAPAVDKPKHSKFVTALFSEGSFQSVSTIGSVLTILGILAVVPSSLVLTGPMALDRLDAKKAALEISARNFSFELASGEINQAYEQILTGSVASNVQLEDDDFEIAEQIAQAFESMSVPDSIAREGGQVLGNALARNVVRENVRRSILTGVSARSSAVETATLADGASQALVAQAESLVKTDSAKSGVRTSVGQQTKQELLQLAEKNPALWRQLKPSFKSYLASFGVSATPQRMEAMIVNQVLGDALSGLGDDGGFWSQQAKSMGASVSADAASAYSEARHKAFVVELSKSTDVSKAMSEASERALTAIPADQVTALKDMMDSFPDMDRWQNDIHSRRMTLTSNTVGLNNARAEAAMLRNVQAGFGSSFASSEFLSEFDDFFPGYDSRDLETRRASTARSLRLSGAPPARTRARGQTRITARAAFKRSFSFGRLRGFSRIGGVLIGRTPETATAEAVSHFGWRLDGSSFYFDLAVDGGEVRHFGPFGAATTNLALAYASDGRPTTVTMVTAAPLEGELKILTHPALLDTGLGCMARKLDQFADAATGLFDELNAARIRETNAAIGEIALYKITRNIQLATIVDSPVGQKAFENLAGHNEEIGNFFEPVSPEEFELAELPLKAPDKTFAIAERPAYFDKQIVSAMNICRAQAASTNYEECVAAQTTKNLSTIVPGQFEWLAPTPSFQTWSGVRERPYDVDGNLSFLDTGSQDLGPLRFMVQVALSSPAYFADPEQAWFEEDNSERDTYTDPKPWELTGIEKLLNAYISDELLKAQPEYARVLKEMQDFILLQRLFRVTLDGALSSTFPLAELEKIYVATQPFVNTNAKTLRWNAFPVGLFEKNFGKILDESVTNKSPAVRQCISFSSNPNAYKATQEEWDAKCGETKVGTSLPQALSGIAEKYSALRELRRDLMMNENNLLAMSYEFVGCPKP